MYIFDTFINNKVCCICMGSFYSVLSMCVILYQYSPVFVVLTHNLRSGIMIPLALLLLLRIELAIWCLLYFPRNFRIAFSSAMENVIRILNRIVLNL